ncbi:septin CDC12 [Sugiyamaella lignohabitans]|uniref:Septin CDC12 n=1 Tax=Sugiyamaella lignohabitans TaxID=796027 RepID=A0A167EQI5_9ASCO|nr:septin CDC12 [Sugiyamaella lignohabitans]ANB14349.1 septin CDC12 [Sugiyamaella lignohabitans]
MLAGESGLGKTTFVNTLFSTTVKGYNDDSSRHKKPIQKTVEISVTKAELEEKGFKVRLNIVDTPGFGDNVNNRDAWQPLVEFIDDQHESYMRQEQQPNRKDKVDMRVHACVYFIRPTGHGLKPLDIETIRKLSTRVNVIPVIAKADTLSKEEISAFKDRIRQTLHAQNIQVYRPATEEELGPSSQGPAGGLNGSGANGAASANSLAHAIYDSMPYSVIASEKDIVVGDGKPVKGRQYLWGVAEVENDEHCDFNKLRNLLIRTHMLDLVLSTEELHYEAYRSQQMETRQFGEGRTHRLVNPKYKEEEDALRKSFSEQVKAAEARFRTWEATLIRKRDELNKDLEDTHSQIRALEAEYEQLARQKR